MHAEALEGRLCTCVRDGDPGRLAGARDGVHEEALAGLDGHVVGLRPAHALRPAHLRAATRRLTPGHRPAPHGAPLRPRAHAPPPAYVEPQ